MDTREGVTAFEKWFEELDARHLSTLSFQEVRRAVQALSGRYVERRKQLSSGATLDGAGKRAAFAYFYGPLHFLLVRAVVRALGAQEMSFKTILDLGCGTGVASAAWALQIAPAPKIVAVDRNAWAVQEARWTYSALGLIADVRVADVAKVAIPGSAAVVAAFTLNELSYSERERLRRQFLAGRGRTAPVLIIEPIAKRLMPWWSEWAAGWKQRGGREDEWRFRITLPERLALMDKAAHLDHRELTARSLFLPPVHV